MQNTQQLLPICAYNNQVYHACFSPKCTQVCFICSNMNCQCKALHKECDKIDWDYITKKLNRDLIKNTPEFKSFSDKLDQLYQNSIKVIAKAYDDFKAWRDNFGLTEFQSSFLHLIQQGKFTDITSAKIYEIRKQIRTPTKIILKSQSQLKKEAESIKNYTEKQCSNQKDYILKINLEKNIQSNRQKMNFSLHNLEINRLLQDLSKLFIRILISNNGLVLWLGMGII